MRKYIKLIFLTLFFITISGYVSSSTFIVDDIKIRGLKQITPGMIFNFLPVGIGDSLDEVKIRKAVRALFKTWYFDYVSLEIQGDALVITVI